MSYLQGWALIVPIAVFNIVVGAWSLWSAGRHARYIRERLTADDPVFLAHFDHPDFPGMREVSSTRAKGAILIGSGLVLLLIQFEPLIFG